MRRLGGIDTMFVRAETPSMHLHVVGVLLLDVSTMRGNDPRQVVKDLVAKRLPLLPPFRWRIVEPPGGIGDLRWIEDPDFDLDQHVHLGTLPAPGTRAELEEFTATVAATPLDRSRPLWQMFVLDGLDDGTVAVVSALHHAFMDGGAGAEVMGELFDLAIDTDAAAPVDTRQPEEHPTPEQLLAETPADVMSRIVRIPGTLKSTAEGARGLIGAVFPGGGGLRPGTGAPKTPFNGPLTPDRVVVLVDCSLADVKQIKRALDTTVNDVVLAAVTSALRADFRAQGILDELGERPLIAGVPISVRPPDSEREFGNKTSILMVPLPTHIDDPIERLEAIHVFANDTKAHHKTMSPDLLEQWASLVPPWVTSMGSRTMGMVGRMGLIPPMSNLTISNVQGSPIPLYLAGAEVVAMYPLGPLLEGGGLNITVISRCDSLHVGLTGDPTLVRDPKGIAAGIGNGIAELLELVARREQHIEEPA